MLKTRHCSQQFELYIFGQGRGHALQIHLFRVFAAGFDKDLMAFLFGKTHDFVLNARAIARALAVDLAGK